MHLFELPLEIFHLILIEAIRETSHADFTRIQTVNKFFCREAQVALCASHDLWSLYTWQPTINHFIRAKALAPGRSQYYALRTIKHCTDVLSVPERRQQICYALSRSAASYTSHLLVVAISNLKRRHPDSRECDDREKLEGWGQPEDTKEHLLAAAACLGDIELVQAFVEQGADINGESHLFRTPLLNAAREGHLNLVQFLLDRDADADHGALRWTDKDRQDRHFVGRSLVPWDPESSYFTALGAAVFAGHEDIVKVLLATERNISRSSSSFFHSITWATWNGKLSVLRMVLACADFDVLGPELTRCFISEMFKESAGSMMKDETSALNYAARKSQINAVRFLLDKGAEVNDQVIEPRTEGPVALAQEGDFERTVAFLLDRGSEGRGHGFNLVALCETPSMMRLLLERKLHERYPSSARYALESAKEEKRGEMVALLLEYGVDPEGKGEDDYPSQYQRENYD